VVPVTTLDALIDKHGIAGLSSRSTSRDSSKKRFSASPARSRRCHSSSPIIQRDVALACIARCIALGLIRFNAALGESQSFVNADWVGAAKRSLAG